MNRPDLRTATLSLAVVAATGAALRLDRWQYSPEGKSAGRRRHRRHRPGSGQQALAQATRCVLLAMPRPRGRCSATRCRYAVGNVRDTARGRQGLQGVTYVHFRARLQQPVRSRRTSRSSSTTAARGTRRGRQAAGVSSSYWSPDRRDPCRPPAQQDVLDTSSWKLKGRRRCAPAACPWCARCLANDPAGKTALRRSQGTPPSPRAASPPRRRRRDLRRGARQRPARSARPRGDRPPTAPPSDWNAFFGLRAPMPAEGPAAGAVPASALQRALQKCTPGSSRAESAAGAGRVLPSVLLRAGSHFRRAAGARDHRHHPRPRPASPTCGSTPAIFSIAIADLRPLVGALRRSAAAVDLRRRALIRRARRGGQPRLGATRGRHVLLPSGSAC